METGQLTISRVVDYIRVLLYILYVSLAMAMQSALIAGNYLFSNILGFCFGGLGVPISEKINTLITFGYEALEYKNINCRLCYEGIETPYHLATECPCLNLFRKEIFYEFNYL